MYENNYTKLMMGTGLKEKIDMYRNKKISIPTIINYITDWHSKREKNEEDEYLLYFLKWLKKTNKGVVKNGN